MWSRPLKSTPFTMSSDAIAETLYPIGSIYMSTVDVDPSTLFGGTWERIKDKFLLCAGDSYSAGSTGGAVSHTHSNPSTGSTAITVAQMPSHSHSGTTIPGMNNTGIKFGGGYVASWNEAGTTDSSAIKDNHPGNSYTHWSQSDITSHTHTFTTNSTGSGEGHTHTVGNTSSSSNMPPYLTVYCWRRTA